MLTTCDLRALRRHLRASGDQAVWQNGDFDYDGRVTSRDYAILRNNFGATMPAGALLTSATA